MTPATCLCGATPAITERAIKELQVVRIECPCGRHGGSVTYLKPGDRERTIAAAVDGWSLNNP